MRVFDRSRFRDFTDEHNRALGHTREFDPLACELGVRLLKAGARCSAGGFLRCFRKFEVPRYSLFAIFVRSHTRTVRRNYDARSRFNHPRAKTFLSSRNFSEFRICCVAPKHADEG